MSYSSVTLAPQRSPLTGVIEELSVNIGQTVQQGELIAILESMKVHVRVEASVSGVVNQIHATLGQTIERDAVIVSLSQDASQAASVDHKTSDTHTQVVTEDRIPPSNTPHPSIKAWIERQSLTLDEQRSDAISKRHAKGYSSARENLAKLCDPKQFTEYGQLAVAAQRQRKDYDALKTDTAADGVITGIGRVAGVQTALIINDYTVLAGTQGYFHHQKVDRMLAVAEQRGLPVVMFTEGGGGRPGDTDVTVVNSGLQCTSFSTWAGLSGVVPRIAIANGYNFAGNAALFGAADITIATRSSWIGMAGPAMIAGGGLGDFKPTEIGPSDAQSSNGVIDILVDNEAQACAIAKQLVAMLTSNTAPKARHKGTDSQEGLEPDITAQDQTPLQAIMPANRRQTYSVRSILRTLADTDTLIELQANYAGSVVTGLMQLGGKTIGVLANDCCVLGGAIDAAAGEKATNFIQLCNDLALPIISFCDTPGFMVGPEHEAQGAVRKLAGLFKAGAKLTVPFYAVVLRKCYGLGAQAMLGGSTKRPLATLSWPSGEFGAMGLEGAVKLGFKKELLAQPDDESRQALFEQLLTKQYANGQATEVASVLELDAVIDPAKTRSTLINLLT